MTKRRPQATESPYRDIETTAEWNIVSHGPTPYRRSMLLKDLGYRMRAQYRHVIEEPPPKGMMSLLEKLDAHPEEPQAQKPRSS